jgi:hypothetical protein
MKLGNAPALAPEEIYNLRGKECAVEFGTRRLLGYGATWAEALQAVYQKYPEAKNFYRYFVSMSVSADLIPKEKLDTQ